MSNINRMGIGNRRDGSVGAWRFARSSGAVCAESMCFETPRNGTYCQAHKPEATAAQPEKKVIQRHRKR